MPAHPLLSRFRGLPPHNLSGGELATIRVVCDTLLPHVCCAEQLDDNSTPRSDGCSSRASARIHPGSCLQQDGDAGGADGVAPCCDSRGYSDSSPRSSQAAAVVHCPRGGPGAACSEWEQWLSEERRSAVQAFFRRSAGMAAADFHERVWAALSSLPAGNKGADTETVQDFGLTLAETVVTL